MDDFVKGFLIEVFKETGAHIRVTERKSLIVTGSYIGLFSIFLSSLVNTCLSGQASPGSALNLNISWLSVVIQSFFLLIGTCIYIMQQWYRAWKEHYLEVSLRIRQKLIKDSDMEDDDFKLLLPYWLRRESSDSRISIDNLLKYVTVIINFILLILVSYQILDLQQNKSLAILAIIIGIAAYIGIIIWTQNRINRRKNLFA
jgi:FtsH-binding integral membrane protein